MSCLVSFKQATGTDFEQIFSLLGDVEKLYQALLTMTILGLQKGYQLENPPLYKKLWNKIRYGQTIGYRDKELVLILDDNYMKVQELIPKFYLAISESDKKK